MKNNNFFIGFMTILLFSMSLCSVAELCFSQKSNLVMSFDEGLVAHWRFNESNNGMIYDVSGNGFHGTIHGNPTWSTGKIGSALEFDGTSDYISITENKTSLFSTLSQLGQGSISVWFRVDYIPVINGISPIFYYGFSSPCTDFFDAANQGLIIEVGHSPIHLGSKRIYFTIWADGCTYPSFCFDSRDSLKEGEWYHFVAVVGSDFNTGYLNGEEIVNRRYNFGDSHYSQFFENAVVHEALWFGKGYWNARKDPSPVYFDGAVDDIRIFSRPLSNKEVKDIYEESSINHPPHKPTVTGPSNGKVGRRYSYSISTIDPDGDDVSYYIDWGDGAEKTCRGPFPSGERITFFHSWNSNGDFIVQVNAQDALGAKSDNATLSVTMPKTSENQYVSELFFNLLRRMMDWH